MPRREEEIGQQEGGFTRREEGLRQQEEGARRWAEELRQQEEARACQAEESGQPDPRPAAAGDEPDRATAGEQGVRELPAAPSAGEDEEESIEEYTARFLARVGASAGGTPRTPRAADRDLRSAAEANPARAARCGPASPSIPRRAPRAQGPPSGRAEKSTDLSAMRELAKFSAQTAIDKHQQSTLRQVYRGKLGVGAFAVVAGATLLFLWNICGRESFLTLLAGILAIAIALWWFLAYRPRHAASRDGQQSAEEAGDEVASQTAVELDDHRR